MKSAPSPAAAGTPRVFVVDDDPALRRALVMLLECEGLEVEAHASAQAFLNAYRAEQPGCLLLDIDMPDLTGLELQNLLAQQGVRIPIIFLTGQADVPKTIQAFKAGAVDFLEKPASDEVLLDRVRGAIAIDARRRSVEERRAAVLDRLQRLTPREREVLELVVAGKSSKEAARELCISHRTVEVHRRRVLEKMRATSLPALIEMAHTCGLLSEEPL
ncbi:MAG: response regulator [Pseudomonadota bacterium]|nr:response regulator [Pseudomonadota bacterium]